MKDIRIEFTNERIIPSGGLAVVGAILGKSDFVKRLNRMDVTPNRSQHQIKNAVNSMLLYSSPSEKWINDDNISVLYQSRYRNLIIVKNRIFWPLPDAVNKAYYDPFNNYVMRRQLIRRGTGSSYTILRIPFFSLENLVDRGLKLTKGYFMSDWKKYTLNIN